MIVVACNAPPLSRLPCAMMHCPCAIDCVVPGACLLYRVWSLTAIAVCAVLPLASVLVMLIVLPATEAIAPWTPGRFAGAVVGDPDGGEQRSRPAPPYPAGICRPRRGSAARMRR